MRRDRRSPSASLGPPPGGSSGPARHGEDLLTAYVDGVSELTAGERRAVEARIAGDDALRAEAEQTRALLGQLRDLAPAADRASAGGEPDWAALERSILDAVGPDVPRPWWRRLGWRWAMPAAALAVGAAILALFLRTPEPATAPTPEVARPAPAPAAPQAAPAPEPGETMALWLDGEDVEIDLAAEELPDAPWESDHNLEDLLPASDLAWVDDLVGEELERAEALLQEPALDRILHKREKTEPQRPPARRKRS